MRTKEEDYAALEPMRLRLEQNNISKDDHNYQIYLKRLARLNKYYGQKEKEQ